MIDAIGPEHGPIVEEYRAKMRQLAAAIDSILNDDGLRTTGFALLVFPFEDAPSPSQDRLNYVSNADRLDMHTLFKEMVARFEYRMQRGGRA